MLNFKLIFLVVLVLFFSFSSYATVINIPDDYATIQQGIDATNDGDTVLVQPGTYVENVSFNGHNIVVGSLFLTTGDTSYIEQTVIDGNSTGTVVTFSSGENGNAIITGFMIKNGFGFFSGGILCMENSSPSIIRNIITNNQSSGIDAESGLGGGIGCIESSALITENKISDNYTHGHDVYGGGFGGGIYCENSQAVISQNIIESNEAFAYGGGIYCLNSTVVIENNIIQLNSADAGAGIYVWSDDSQISDNIIRDNDCNYGGGGIFCGNSSSNISLNYIAGNTSGSGGGICCSGAYPLVHYNIITSNYAANGGGIKCSDSQPEIVNSVIYSNTAEVGAGICGGRNSDFIVINTILWDDSANVEGSEVYLDSTSYLQVTYSDIKGSYSGNGNIDVNPFFRDPDNGDFHLMAIECGDLYDSPCIDMGKPSVLDSLLDCDWGLGTERSDIGAYGSGEGTVDIDESIVKLPQKYMLSQNYPNPFNASTMIEYDLPTQAQVTLDIYDILGRKVITLDDGLKPAGSHQVVWNAGELSSGVYFYKLQAGDYSESNKMILMK